MTVLSIHANVDTQDQVLGASGVDWVEISPDNDEIILTKGNLIVADGQPIPSSFERSKAGIILDGTNQTVEVYLLADLSANLLKEIHNMGNQDKRYVLAFDFDGITTSEPVLEAWDNINMNSINNTSLGGGTPSSSWLKGIVTTDSLPGANWTGTRLAGSGAGNFLYLNSGNGALSGAKTLYCNLKLDIPSTQTASGAEVPVLVVKYTTA